MEDNKLYTDLFKQKGYVLIPNVLANVDINKCLRALEEVIKKVNSDPKKYSTRYTFSNGEEFDTWGVNHIFESDLYEEAFGEVLYNNRIINFVKNVLGNELRWWCAHALWSPTKVDYNLYWHRDFGDFDVYNEQGNSTHVQFNVALTDDECFHAVPGSHKRPLTAFEQKQLVEKGTAILPYQETIVCHPGDVLFMNAHTFHRGSCSVNTFRRTIQMNLQAINEPTGGHRSTDRLEAVLHKMNPTVKQLMQNAIVWDKNNPLSNEEFERQELIFQQKWKYLSGQS